MRFRKKNESCTHHTINNWMPFKCRMTLNNITMNEKLKYHRCQSIECTQFYTMEMWSVNWIVQFVFLLLDGVLRHISLNANHWPCTEFTSVELYRFVLPLVLLYFCWHRRGNEANPCDTSINTVYSPRNVYTLFHSVQLKAKNSMSTENECNYSNSKIEVNSPFSGFHQENVHKEVEFIALNSRVNRPTAFHWIVCISFLPHFICGFYKRKSQFQ